MVTFFQSLTQPAWRVVPKDRRSNKWPAASDIDIAEHDGNVQIVLGGRFEFFLEGLPTRILVNVQPGTSLECFVLR